MTQHTGDTPAQYPEHEKLHKIADKSQAVGEFIEWLRSEKEWTFATNHHHSDDCYGDQGFRICGLRQDELVMVQFNIPALLAEFFDIDQRKIEAEKQELLEELRKS